MKKILTLMMIFMMMVIPAGTSAPIYFALPINGRVSGSVISGLTIQVTNIRTGKIQTETTTGAGEFLVDAANFDDSDGSLRYIYGDSFKVEILNCVDDPNCVKIVTWMGETEMFSNFDIGGAVEEPEPECTVDSDCDSGYECINEECSLIPEEPECTVDSDCGTDQECISEECEDIEPEPVPEQEVATKATANADKTMVSIDAFYGQEICVLVKNNKLENLIDEEIRFDHDDYDVHEQITLCKTTVKTSLDADGTTTEKYGLEPRVVIKEGGINYKYFFDDKILDLDEIQYDEELEIKVLGEDYVIIEAKADEIVVERGELHRNLKMGAIVDFEGKELKIEHIGNDKSEGSYVKVSYDGESERIYQGDLGEVGDIQVLAEDVTYDEDVINTVDIKVAEEIEVTIKDGEDYSDKEEYRWIIDMPNYIGIENIEDYIYVGDEDEPEPLSKGDKIELPNDFAVIKFNDITTSDTTEIEIKVKEGYLYVKGDADDSFEHNSEDYKKINVDADGIYDEDLESLGITEIQIGDSDIKLESGSIIVGSLKILQDMSDILYNGISFATDDENYLDVLGIIFKDPENGVKETNGFEIIIPDERPEITITIGAEPKDDEDDEEDEEEEDDVVVPGKDTPDPVDPTDDPSLDDPEVIDEPEVIIDLPVIDEPPVITEPEPASPVLLKILITLAIAVLGFFGWGAGFTGLANYWFNKGKELEAAGKHKEAKACYDRAAKMLKTALKRAKEGYYDKK